MNKETRSKIPEGVTRVDIPATGESMISMGEDIGWIKGPYDAVKAVQKLIIDGEGYRKRLAEYKEDMEIAYAELTLTRNELDNATAKLHGMRNHLTEVTMREDG